MISRFKNEQSAEYQAAVRALRALPSGDASCAFADATHVSRLESFKGTRGAKQRQPGSHVCVERLKGKRRCPSYNVDCIEIPNGDHLSEWTINGKTVAILSQPYGLTYNGLRETLAFCEQHDLEVVIDTYPSFHYPGTVLSLIFTRKGSRRLDAHVL